MALRDPLVLAYAGFKQAIQRVHGVDFVVRDEQPAATDYKITLPAANISYVSGRTEKALMRDNRIHGQKKNGNGTYTLAWEIMRFEYLLQISFFARLPAEVQKLSTAFILAMETENEIILPNDPWQCSMNVFLSAPPLPPRGSKNLYQIDQTWECGGKLLLEENVNEVDISNLRFRAGTLM